MTKQTVENGVDRRTSSELADYLGCSMTSIKRYKRQQYIRPQRVNSQKHLYDLHDTIARLHRLGMYEHIQVPAQTRRRT